MIQRANACACRQTGLARYSKGALNAAHTGPLPIGAQDKFLDELEIRTALWFQSSIGITIKAMKLLLTFVVCTVLDYVHAVTFPGVWRFCS